jgi:2-haloacid dehalogenase
MWPKVITFDCYGTLVRWPETLRAVFDSIASDARGADFHKDFSLLHVELKDAGYRPYAEVLQLALQGTMRKWGLDGFDAAYARLMHAIRAIPPYPDVLPVLRRLAQTHRLAIISNTEDALIADTVRGLEVNPEVITAEQAMAFKPDHRLFAYAHERLGVTAAEVLHVGAGLATDMLPAFELGIARIWINRRGEQADPARPVDAELPDLAGLPDAISALARAR